MLLSLVMSTCSTVTIWAIPPSPAAPSGFCSTLDTKTSTMASTISQRHEDLQKNRDVKIASIAASSVKHEEQLKLDRAAWDDKRTENATKLRQRAKTPLQQSAVETYISAVSRAVTNRRKALDAAQKEFDQKSLALLSARKQTVRDHVDSFKNDVSAAIKEAKSSCASQPQQTDEIYRTLKLALLSAREAFNRADNTTNLVNNGSDLVKARTAAVASAIEIYKSAVEQAKTDLKGAFGDQTI